jgi:regulator of protease activity HflC (stomatin/prohibitin superfamily)
MKAEPTTYVMQFQRGQRVREGAGLSFFYFGPRTSLVAVPIASVDVPFMFEEVSADFQEMTVQGEVTYRVADPQRLAVMLNFTLTPCGRRYMAEDPQKLPDRVVAHIKVLVRAQLQRRALRDALQGSDALVAAVRNALTESTVLGALGIEVLDLSIRAIKPNPETARALEAGVREQLLRAADEAVYERRNAAVEQERRIRENELNTEIAVEEKKREIRETQMDAERAVQEKQRVMATEEMAGQIALEQQNRELVELATANAREKADADAYAIGAQVNALRDVEPQALQALASVGMEPKQLIALAFRDLADNAGKVGHLNLSPDLLRELLEAR